MKNDGSRNIISMRKKVSISKLMRFSIIIFWMVMMALLIQKNYFSLYGDYLKPSYAAGQMRPKEEWMGVYWGKDKVGYTVSTIKKKMRGYEIFEQALMDLTVMGTPQRIDTHLTSQVDESFTLRSFEFRLFSNVFSFKAGGKVKGNELLVELVSGGTTTKSTIPLKEIPCLSSSLKSLLLAQGLSEGTRVTYTVFDPSTMSTTPVEVVVEGKETVSLKDKMFKCYRLRSSFKGITLRSWIDEDGTTIKEESPLGLILVKESKVDALTENWSEKTKDIIAASAIPVTRAISIREPSYLTIRLKGINLKEFNLSQGRQKLQGDLLEVVKEQLSGFTTYAIPYDRGNMTEHLSSTTFIQSDDPLIITQAKEIVGSERNAVEAVKLIKGWVYNTIEKKPTLSIPSALDVLKMRVGDCNEHATLFVALCRALGIPSTLCVGIVYSQGSFYYHAWSEVFVGRWVSVDPTMNQMPADATHIKFVEGGLDKQLEIIKLIGVLKLEVVDYS